MKFFICIALIAAVGAVCATQSGSSTSVNTNTNQDLETEAQSAQVNNERFRKSAGYGGGASGGYGGGSSGGYGGASIPAPPCPKNYLFSCQPNLAPVPCSSSAASYGSSGAYTAPVPTFVAPVGNNYGIPHGYNGFVPQSFNQFYQY